MFNKKLAKLVADAKRPDYRVVKYRLHDAWLMLVAIVCGKVIYDENSYMLYRIHSANTVGIGRTSVLKRVGKLQRFFSKRDDANLRMRTAQELIDSFKNIEKTKKEILCFYANYQNSWQDKYTLLTNQIILQECGENSIVFRLKVMLNFV